MACNPIAHCGEPITATLAGVALGVVLDYVYPEHRGWLLRVHPVHTAFLMARWLAPPGSGMLRGGLAWLSVMSSHLIAAWLFLAAATAYLGVAGYIAATALISKVSLGHRLLYIHVSRVAAYLAAGHLGEARREVSRIVRRDTSRLGAGHVASAAIESLFENIVDAYVSPLLYTVLLGPLAGFAQRVANTLDGALGFKTPEYARAGRVSAGADTVLNYIPARLAAIATLASSPILLRRAVRLLLVCARATESVNAGYPLAAAALVLGVRLEKPGSYVICPSNDLPSPADVTRAVRLAFWASSASTGIVVALSLVVH